MSASIATVLLLILCGSWTSAADWHPVRSSFCSQIKAKGANVSYRSFSILEAPDENSKCCDGLSLKAKGKTEEFGHFRVLGLNRGRYFISFDLKTKTVNVPVLVDSIVDQRGVGKDCEPWSRITVDKKTNEVAWEEWIVVD